MVVQNPSVGEEAPDFSLKNQTGNPSALSDFRGKWLVLYFYPKDNTPGCTIEGREFTKQLNVLRTLNAEVCGISSDSVKSHCNFIEKEKLGVTLLSDERNETAKAYGVWGKKINYGKEYFGIIRSTFLISPEGKIIFVWSQVKPEGHAEEVVKKIRNCVH